MNTSGAKLVEIDFADMTEPRQVEQMAEPDVSIQTRECIQPAGSPFALTLGFIGESEYIPVFFLGHIQPESEHLPAVINDMRSQTQFGSLNLPQGFRTILSQRPLNFPMRDWQRYVNITAMGDAERTEAILQYQSTAEFPRDSRRIYTQVNSVALGFGGNQQIWYLQI